jgi:hypothetical protein
MKFERIQDPVKQLLKLYMKTKIWVKTMCQTCMWVEDSAHCEKHVIYVSRTKKTTFADFQTPLNELSNSVS